MGDLISKKDLIKRILKERDKYPLEIEERYGFGCKTPNTFNQALRGGMRKCLRIIEEMPSSINVEELSSLTVRVVEKIIEYDYDFIVDNYDCWDDYLNEAFGISYDDFVMLTGCTLQEWSDK